MRVQEGRPARPGIFSCGEHVVAVGGADNGKIGCQVWSLLLRGSGMGGGTSLWSRNVTLSLSLILRYLVVTVKGPALNARLGSAHPPCEGDEAVPAFWVELSRLVLVHSSGWFVIMGVDVNAQPVPCVGIVTGDVARAGGASADVACSYAAAALQHLGL